MKQIWQVKMKNIVDYFVRPSNLQLSYEASFSFNL